MKLKDLSLFSVHKEDEIKCLIRGCNLLLQNITDEAFTYHHHEQTKYNFDRHTFGYPYILINIGSGVSVIRVSIVATFNRTTRDVYRSIVRTNTSE